MEKNIKAIEEVKVEVKVAPQLEMRELRGDDLFTLLSLIGKLDIKDEFIKLFGGDGFDIPMDFQEHKTKNPTKKQKEAMEDAILKREREAEMVGVEMMAGLLQKVLVGAPVLKKDLNELLSELTEASVDEIKRLSLIAYTKLLVDFFKKEELKDFFTSIASLL